MIGLARFPESASNWIGASNPFLLLLVAGYGLSLHKIRTLGTTRFPVTVMFFIVSSLSYLYVLADLILDGESIIGPDYSRTRYLIAGSFFAANLAATVWAMSLSSACRWYMAPAFGVVTAFWLFIWLVSAVV